jgi:cytochrome c oxidase cbb3-type subunit 3
MSFRRFAAALVLMIAAGAYPVMSQSGQQAAGSATAGIQKGKQIYLGLCSRCHGAEGGGGDALNLNRPDLTRARTDQELMTIIRNGLPEVGMPRIRRFTDAEVLALTAYVRSLSRVAPAPQKGDTGNGKLLYGKLGCSACHIIAGEGGSLGPELTSVGAHRTAEYIRQAILDPGSALPRGVMPVPGRGYHEYLPVRVVTRDGRQIRGLRVNEDSFTIQLRDVSGHLFSLRKADLQQLDKQLDQSIMPEYKSKTSPSQVEDLVSYLCSLRGEK